MNSHIMVIYSCRRYEHTRVFWQAQTWPRRLPQHVEYRVMTGGGDGEIDVNGVLRLDVSDGYNALIDKTQALFDWFLDHSELPWLVKCDDDVWLSPIALEKVVTNESPYAGVYGDIWAGGPLYVLHRDVIAQLGRLRDYVVDGDLSEDTAVGRAAKDIGVQLNLLGIDDVLWYDPNEHQLTEEHSYDMGFCFTRKNHQSLMAFLENRYRDGSAKE